MKGLKELIKPEYNLKAARSSNKSSFKGVIRISGKLSYGRGAPPVRSCNGICLLINYQPNDHRAILFKNPFFFGSIDELNKNYRSKNNQVEALEKYRVADYTKCINYPTNQEGFYQVPLTSMNLTHEKENLVHKLVEKTEKDLPEILSECKEFEFDKKNTPFVLSQFPRFIKENASKLNSYFGTQGTITLTKKLSKLKINIIPIDYSISFV